MLDLDIGGCERVDKPDSLNLDVPKIGASSTTSSSSSILSMLSSQSPPFLGCSDCAKSGLDDAKPGPAFDFGRAGVPLAVRGGNRLDTLGWKLFVDGESVGTLNCNLRPPSAELPYTEEGGGPAGVVEKCAGRSENRGL